MRAKVGFYVALHVVLRQWLNSNYLVEDIFRSFSMCKTNRWNFRGFDFELLDRITKFVPKCQCPCIYMLFPDGYLGGFCRVDHVFVTQHLYLSKFAVSLDNFCIGTSRI